MSDDLELRGFPITDEALPEGWLLTNLGKVVAEFQSGFACGNHNSEGRGIIHLRPMNISTDGRLVLNDVRFVEVEVTNWLKAGDVLFNNTNSSELVGKTALASGRDKYAFSNHMTRIRVSSALEASFLATELQYLFRHGYFKVHCNNHVSQASISSKYLNHRLPFIVPPLPEQRRIVAKIEALQSRSRKAREALEAIPPLLEQFRQSVLAAAFRGDLTADWREQHPEVEPASVLLDRIRTERRRKWEESELIKFKAKGKLPKDDSWKVLYVEPEPVDETDLPELPAGWSWASMEILTLDGPQNGLYVPRTKYVEGTPILRIDDYQTDWCRSSTELQQIDIDEATYKLYELRTGDLVVNRVNSPSHLGKSIVITESNIPAVFESNMMRLELASQSVAYYCHYFLTSTFGKVLLTKNAKWAVNQASINQGDVVATPIPLAPTHEQQAILDLIRNAQNRAKAATIEIAKSQYGIIQLDHSILAKAFRGELVPQDPNDEPATQLLERIQSERANDTNTKPARRPRKPTSTSTSD